jgi:hypothetical protein
VKISYSPPTKSSAELTPATAPNGSTPLQFFGKGAGVEDGFILSTAYGLTPEGPALGTGHFTLAENRYAIGDDLLWTHGAHSVRMGFAGDRLLNNSWNPINEDVVWTFTSFANFLAGQASLESGVVPAPTNTAHRDYFQYDFNPYIQDDWKVTSKLPDEHKADVKRKLQNAYAMADYTDAKRALDRLHRELMDLNPSAARSLEEGMEETLTVHKLRVPDQLRRTLCCTNVIESAFSIVETVCRNVKRWRDGDHIER